MCSLCSVGRGVSMGGGGGVPRGKKAPWRRIFFEEEFFG
jgi:hypothetical protein